MSVGQSKNIRARQGKMNRLLDITEAKVMGIKERQDKKKARARKLVARRPQESRND